MFSVKCLVFSGQRRLEPRNLLERSVFGVDFFVLCAVCSLFSVECLVFEIEC